LVKRVSVVPAAQIVPARITATAHNQVAVNARTRFSVCGSLAGAPARLPQVPARKESRHESGSGRALVALLAALATLKA
jgi:hypothetical protein